MPAARPRRRGWVAGTLKSEHGEEARLATRSAPAWRAAAALPAATLAFAGASTLVKRQRRESETNAQAWRAAAGAPAVDLASLTHWRLPSCHSCVRRSRASRDRARIAGGGWPSHSRPSEAASVCRFRRRDGRRLARRLRPSPCQAGNCVAIVGVAGGGWLAQDRVLVWTGVGAREYRVRTRRPRPAPVASLLVSMRV